MNKLIAYFPEVVYYCDCLQEIIEKCEKPSSLHDICNKIDNNKREIYCVLCGDDEQDVVFSCIEHLTMETLVVEIHNANVVVIETKTRNYCLSCIRKNLRKKYQMFNYEIFNK